MERITGAEGLLLFFAYCILGWIWETLFVSACKRKWVNRGFLKGPWLPIYGCGAGVVLLSTWTIRENMVLVFIVGMVSATILEYITGVLMEKLFKMRYWDYSDKLLNLKGYICLPVSLGWGLVAVSLQIVNSVILYYITQIPQRFAEIFCFVLLFLFAIDVTKSVQAAFDMEELLHKISNSHKSMEKAEKKLNDIWKHYENRGESVSEKRKIEKPVMVTHKQNTGKRLLELLDERRRQKDRLISAMQERVEVSLQVVSQELIGLCDGKDRQRLEEHKAGLIELQRVLHDAEIEIAARKDRDFQRAVAILKRNPTAVSHKYADALEELKELKNEETW